MRTDPGCTENLTRKTEDVLSLYTSIFVNFLLILSVVMFVVAFATGPGSIPWFFVTELFTQNARPVATTVANAVNWAANFIVGFSFPLIEEEIEENVFLIFIVFQIGFLLFVWKYVPETKGKTVGEITAEYRS